MAAKMGKLFLLMSGLALMLLSMNAKADDAAIDSTPEVPTEGANAVVETGAPKVEDLQPSNEEKTIFSTILKSFKNGHVDLATLATALNDPNISRLASTLSKANLTKLSAALDGPQGPDLKKLVAALNDPEINLDKLVDAFGDSALLSSPPQNTMGVRIMDTMKEWARTLHDKVQSSPVPPAPAPPSLPENAEKQDESDKRHAKLEGLMHESDKLMEQDDDGIPAGFERSTPRPDAETYGKSLMSGKEETVPAMATAPTEETDVEGSAQSTMPLNHKMLYLLLAGVFGLSMIIFLATRFAKSYRGDGEAEETVRGSTRMTA